MRKLKLILLLLSVTFFIFACSNDNEGATNSEDAEQAEQASETTDDNDSEEVSNALVKDIEEEIGMDKGDNLSIPDGIPSDVPLPDDMEIEMTIDNELMTQVWINTKMSIDELKVMYEDYITSNYSSELDYDDFEMEGHYNITYTVPTNGNEFYIQFIDDDEDGDVQTVTLTTVSDDFELELDFDDE